jgi:hypothetical protein
MMLALFLMSATALFLAKPVKAQEPRMWASPEKSTVTVYSPPTGSNPRWNISIMVENLPHCLVASCFIKIDDYANANITNFYKGDLFSSPYNFAIFQYGGWDTAHSDVQDLTAGSTTPKDISTPVEVFKIEIEAKSFVPSVLVDVYAQYAGDIDLNDLLTGDCPNDYTVYMNQYKTHPIIVDSTSYNVTTLSNSTVSSITLDQAGMAITFNVTGSVGTKGYVNVTIPKTLLNAETTDWTIMLDDVAASATISANATHTIVQLNYTHSDHRIRIQGTWVVPEFPSATAMLALLTTIAIAFALIRKVHKKPWQTL